MARLSAQFNISPNEIRRGIMDYTAQLADGETITSFTVSVTALGDAPSSPAFVINNTALGPSPASQIIFYASGGTAGYSYEAEFLATTSAGQVFDDVVRFNVRAKL